MPLLKQRLNECLIGRELWRDKRSEDVFAIVSSTANGWASSNVRKGTTKNVFELDVRVWFRGERGGAELKVCLTFMGLDHELLEQKPVVMPEPVITSEAGANQVKEKVLDKDGNVIERVVGEVEPERAMRTNEMFLKLVRQKGITLVTENLLTILHELAAYGKGAEGDAGKSSSPLC